jgi:hypothetical protein
MTKDKNGSNISLIILIVYLVSSIFAGLIFSVLSLRNKSMGGSGIGFGILSVICIAAFGYMGYGFYVTSSPNHDTFYYYLGIVTLIANGLATLILIATILKKR